MTARLQEAAAAGPSGPAVSLTPAAQTPVLSKGDHARRETLSLMSSRVGDVFLRAPYVASGATDLISLCRELAARDISDALVEDGDRIGMFTTTKLRDALLMDRPPAALTAAELASFPIVSISIDADLHEAMILMLRHRVHRLVVRDETRKRGDRIVGVLSQLDLMGFVANNSHLIAAEAAAAETVAQLKHAADQIQPLIAILHQDGVRVEVIAGLVGELNRAVFQRLWELVAPADLRENSCLIVMGSEGRGEQIIRTDQDNGLILRDGYAGDPAPATQAFTEALVDFGYPRCPGGIMASNPVWRQPLAGYRQMIGHWLYGEGAEGPMNLAIFMDAVAVAGDAGLLDDARAHLLRLVSDSDAYLARFAAAVNSFAEDGSWWSRLPGMRGRGAAEIDIKKLGIFPLVQGARALALQYRIPQLNSADRLAGLSAEGRLPPALARDAADALNLLIGVKLDNNLRQIAAGRAPDNLIRLNELGTLDREGLRDALAIVKSFREWVSAHFRLAG